MSGTDDPTAKKPHAAAETVKLDADALRKLVVSTVVTIDDDDEAAAKEVPARPDGPPRPR
jgi:hypothetical protein